MSGESPIDDGRTATRALQFDIFVESAGAAYGPGASKSVPETAPATILKKVIQPDDLAMYFQTHGELPAGFSWGHVRAMKDPEGLLSQLSLAAMGSEWRVGTPELRAVGISPADVLRIWGSELEAMPPQSAAAWRGTQPSSPPRSNAVAALTAGTIHIRL